MITKISDKKINLKIFLPPVIALCAFVISGAIWPKKIGGLMTSMLYGMADHFGWYLNLLSLLLLILAVCIVISRYGDVRIGGRDAKPEFTTFQWISMTICGGIGTGLLFWAMGEPIFHYAVPPWAQAWSPSAAAAPSSQSHRPCGTGPSSSMPPTPCLPSSGLCWSTIKK